MMATEAQVRNCRSCHCRVYWLTNDMTARIAPIDVELPKDGKGNVVVNLADHTYRVLSPAKVAALGSEGLHVSHFATCPKAPYWHRAD